MSDQKNKSDIELYVIRKVKLMREERGISQARLAYLLDLSIGFIGHVESPKYPAKYNLNHLNKLAKIFECSPKDFLPETYFI
ncbi:helix-turn-helix domain-containing protein [Sphingobacterium thalpophilum]|uniref:helix-turn-helix domain-containing protein n=1 Tax=Sphingobacterium thalpophilum TaxID=259 RepID=UPI002D765960|nr:helix-turn-helix transcriptional regulator [Sphingobacterium thalpophilum]